jgi:hypothetical protein
MKPHQLFTLRRYRRKRALIAAAYARAQTRFAIEKQIIGICNRLAIGDDPLPVADGRIAKKGQRQFTFIDAQDREWTFAGKTALVARNQLIAWVLSERGNARDMVA